MLDKFKDSKVVLWAVAFVGVSVLVALGKLKPETIEYLLFALLGQANLPKKVPELEEKKGDE